MTAVAVRPRSFVVLAGLPGAGKSTLLAHLDSGGAPVVVLDSDQVRTRLRAVFPERLPYRVYRPLVHLVHRLRVLVFAIGGTGLLVVHEPSTRPTTRAGLVAVGALTGRHRLFLWLDATADEALAGQVERGRLVRGRSFSRHVRRAAWLRGRFAGGWVPRGWDALVVVTRQDRVRLSVTPD
ncbi:AAA family ATPase [Umezawaea sp. Da 62-37]|uniref:AAA family ATPase n=1 Tax=Umezawaea sp. Da 62-37 TaxID=3075927 RepID=UPI0028F735B5|nr:AAA family ATPase [Umezawaea sp. Da 62-37]WNV89897.1 AAA family ATPase [Umezawaea sp. Da 62-37]